MYREENEETGEIEIWKRIKRYIEEKTKRRDAEENEEKYIDRKRGEIK